MYCYYQLFMDEICKMPSIFFACTFSAFYIYLYNLCSYDFILNLINNHNKKTLKLHLFYILKKVCEKNRNLGYLN